MQISSNCPKYLKMLIDSVRDLDEWNSWTADSSEIIAGDVDSCATPQLGSFKKKVYEMAKGKGDKGILPFLESLGLSLSSAIYLASYLSSSHSQTLPLLIHKVKYVKEIFFSDSDDDGIIGKNARRMMMHLSISAEEDLQQTLSFFEKIQARRGGLNLLGCGSASFRYLIESFPRLLLLPVESHMKPMMNFLEDIGVPRGCTKNILLLFPPILFYNIDKDIKPRLLAFEKVGIQDNDFGKMLIKYPWILSSSILENFQKVVNLFDEEKVPKACSSRAIRNWPLLLGCSVNNLKMMVDQFGELGIRSNKLGKVIVTSPQLLHCRPPEFLQVVSFLKDLGLEEEAISRILGRCPEIFATSIDRTLKKKLEFLSSIGVSRTHLPRVIRKYPELFVCDVNRALLPRMKYLMKIGLSRRDIGFMVRRFSPLLGYSIDEVLRPKLEFLTKTMKKPLSEVVDYPRYFSYSLEKKIKPRFWLLKSINMECSLKEMLGKNDEEFAADYMGVEQMVVPPS
ncbi:Mitochondrial transcription termination factor family protein [Forsythia ovata]|uniref:Mitochondrial transcription termination factor family protein n=1 Tax=Forsythia ovata TaxID=205694 RepID=A0ABD1PF81_9LAMI